jgi:hypothetical protein
MKSKINPKQLFLYFITICLIVLFYILFTKILGVKEGQTDLSDSQGGSAVPPAGPQSASNAAQSATQNYQSQLLTNLDAKIKQITDLLDNLDKTLPKYVKDIIPGNITTISYEDAIKQNALNPITINVGSYVDPTDKTRLNAKWSIDMQIPLGPKGDKGDKGPIGVNGDTGSKGPPGETGLRGKWWNS